MKLKLVRSMWGVLEPEPNPNSWSSLFDKLKMEGYSAIECPVGPYFGFRGYENLFKELLKKYGFEYVAQVHTCGYPVSSNKVEDHLSHFRQGLKDAKSLGAIFVNSHSGTDTWTFEQAKKFFESCLKIESEEGIKVVHETHRRRVLYNPWVTRDLLKALPELKVNADLSHWAVVSERLFDDPCDSDWWPETIEMVANRCHFIHARVGYSEGPQVPDPSASEYSNELKSHEKWWSQIWDSQAKRGQEFSYVEPEHGPSPYLHTLPHTNVPVADLWKVNSWIGRRVTSNFEQKYIV